jgi:hypothetical protein
MAKEKRLKIAIVLVLLVSITLSLFALVEIFFPLFKLYVLEYSVAMFIGALILFSLYDLFLLNFFCQMVKTPPVKQATGNKTVRWVYAGLGTSIFIKCFYLFYYRIEGQFLPALFSDIWLILSDLATYVPIMFFFYSYYCRLKYEEDRPLKMAGLLSFTGVVVIVAVNGITLLALLFPGIFSWYFSIENTIIITLPRAFGYFSLLYFFLAFSRGGKHN